MPILRLFPDFEEGFAYIESTGFDDDVRFGLIDGEVVADDVRHDLTIRNVTKRFPDFLGTGSSEFFVSERMKQLLEEWCPADEMNFIEIDIRGRTYHLLNLLGSKRYMDHERSTFTAFADGYPDMITDLVLLEEQIGEYEIYRLYERPAAVFVTEGLASLFQQAGLTGFTFLTSPNLEVLS